MKFTFLEAKVPLHKQFKLNGQDIESTPYPLVKNLTSHSHTANTMAEAYPLLQHHAQQGHALLNGYLTREIKVESRAGLADKDAGHQWICLDFDKANLHSVDFAVQSLGLDQYSHIIQHSASSNIPGREHELNCHIFFGLSGEVRDEVLKDWIFYLNHKHFPDLLVPRSYGGHYDAAVDPAMARSTQIIYLSTPSFNTGLVDPHDDVIEPRWRLELRDHDLLPSSVINQQVPSPAVINSVKSAMLDDARAAAGLRGSATNKIKFDPKVSGSQPVCSDPIPARVTGKKVARGFVYLNINGGDSWGYYHPENNPKWIHNFKAEPIYPTDKFLPEYFPTAAEHANENAHKPDIDGNAYFVLQAKHNNDLYNVEINHNKQQLHIARTSEMSAKRWMFDKRGITEDAIKFPIVRLEYRPDLYSHKEKSGFGLLELGDEHVLNTYEPPYIVTQNREDPKVPFNIKKVLFHLLGSCDKTYKRFLHWLAFIIQTNERTQTAWVITGAQGTGKGVLGTNILTPLLGTKNVSQVSLQNFASRFTEAVDSKQVIILDEMSTKSYDMARDVKDKLKRQITESTLKSEKKFEGQRESMNFSNIIITSNEIHPVLIERGDRRFHVAPRQKKTLRSVFNDSVSTLTDVIEVQIPTELPEFYEYLIKKKVDMNLVRRVEMNEYKENMIAASTTATDEFVDAWLDGDAEYFYGVYEEHIEGADLKSIAVLTGNDLKHVFDNYFKQFLEDDSKTFILNTQEFETMKPLFLSNRGHAGATSFRSWAKSVGLPYVTREYCTISDRKKSGVVFRKPDEE